MYDALEYMFYVQTLTIFPKSFLRHHSHFDSFKNGHKLLRNMAVI